MKKILVFGAGGLARDFADFFSRQVDIIGFSSKDNSEFTQFNLPGDFFEGDLLPDRVGTDLCVIAIGNPTVKKTVSENLKLRGFSFPNLIHPSTVANIKFNNKTEGVIISPNCTVGSNVKFNSHIYVNYNVGIGHDTYFHNYIQVNPGAQIGGFSIIKNEVLIGSGATIRQGLSVGKGATVGSGAAVVSEVESGTIVGGIPAKII